MFEAGTKFQANGEDLEIRAILGQGAEGTVFEVLNETGVPTYALKWYHTGNPDRRLTLAELIDRGRPHRRFLWPLGIIDETAGRSFGYLMPIRPPEYVGVARLLSGKVPRHETAVLHLCFELAHGFLALHGRGLCYRDISLGNVLFEPAVGCALICDNDHVAVDGASSALVRGTPKFMAPEVVRGDAAPSRRTDQYSLAVLLFYMLLVGHPLEGVRTQTIPGFADRETHLRFFGDDPRFCFDPQDDSNRPMPGHMQGLWDSYPQFVRELFTRSFTDGLHSPSDRVKDSEWCFAMSRLRDCLYPCPSCGTGRYLDPSSRIAACPGCHAATAPDLVVRLDRHRMVVSDAFLLTRHHLDDDFDIDSVIATAERHPHHPARLGIKNHTSEPWHYLCQDGRRGTLKPGDRLLAIAGMRFWIGDHTAYVEQASTP